MLGFVRRLRRARVPSSRLDLELAAGRLFREIMKEPRQWDVTLGSREALRLTARAAIEDWLEAR